MADQLLWPTGLPNSQVHQLDNPKSLQSVSLGGWTFLTIFDIPSVRTAGHVKNIYSPSVGAAARLTIFTARQSGRLDIDNIDSRLVEAILEHAYAAPSDNAFKHLNGMW